MVPTKERIAKQVAEVVRDFIRVGSSSSFLLRPLLTILPVQDYTGHPINQSSNERWRVGEGHITLDRVCLTGLMQVSRSSWQPTLVVLVD